MRPLAEGRLITLENFIIDTFTRVDADGIERPVDRADEIGGGGTYGIIGARIFLPPERLGMIIDFTAESMPESMRATLMRYGPEMWFFRERDDGYPTNKSVNRYTGDVRIFEYLCPARYLHLTDILATPWADAPPRSIHLISDAARLRRWPEEMLAAKRVLGQDWDPTIVWEPEPYDNVPENMDLFRTFVPNVAILSPNHTETFSLLSLGSAPAESTALRTALSAAAHQLLALKPRLGVVIRAGAHGACYLAHGQGEPVWVPAYWSDGVLGWAEKVVDPTGAGNAFCGGMAAALDQDLSLAEAVDCGTIAASFVVEQHGLPLLGADGLWNGESPQERLTLYRKRRHACMHPGAS